MYQFVLELPYYHSEDVMVSLSNHGAQASTPSFDKLRMTPLQTETLLNKEAGRIVPEFEGPNIRELIEGSYRIIYQIRADIIGIIRVHHAARLLNSLL